MYSEYPHYRHACLQYLYRVHDALPGLPEPFPCLPAHLLEQFVTYVISTNTRLGGLLKSKENEVKSDLNSINLKKKIVYDHFIQQILFCRLCQWWNNVKYNCFKKKIMNRFIKPEQKLRVFSNLDDSTNARFPCSDVRLTEQAGRVSCVWVLEGAESHTYLCVL